MSESIWVAFTEGDAYVGETAKEAVKSRREVNGPWEAREVAIEYVPKSKLDAALTELERYKAMEAAMWDEHKRQHQWYVGATDPQIKEECRFVATLLKNWLNRLRQ